MASIRAWDVWLTWYLMGLLTVRSSFGSCSVISFAVFVFITGSLFLWVNVLHLVSTDQMAISDSGPCCGPTKHRTVPTLLKVHRLHSRSSLWLEHCSKTLPTVSAWVWQHSLCGIPSLVFFMPSHAGVLSLRAVYMHINATQLSVAYLQIALEVHSN